MVGVLALSAMAQADHSQLPDIGGATATEPSDDSPVTPNSMPHPQDSLTAYEEQMAIVTVQTYTELTQIAEALHSGQISDERAEYLTRRSFELGVVRLQFLDTLHQIAEGKVSREAAPERPEEQARQTEASGETLLVPPPSSPNIPESVRQTAREVISLAGTQNAHPSGNHDLERPAHPDSKGVAEGTGVQMSIHLGGRPINRKKKQEELEF
jgi:hypothetical protein